MALVCVSGGRQCNGCMACKNAKHRVANWEIHRENLYENVEK